ncbi:SRPBCC domain-containing protein [Pseudonocardiaceae bacterium YIM PH 21723]|nr:SRPBCC domain-containing protein [Pseudonocardiaceae bacterium YIM PH 21723]
MPREFEIRKEVELEATPEQVWAAISTGPGIDSWFMGPHTVEPGVGGQIRMSLGDFQEQSTITAWEPGKQLAYRTESSPAGEFHAMEYLIEAREGGTVGLRFVHSGVMSDDWGDEFVDSTSHGWTMYLHTLQEVLRHFPGREGHYVYVAGPPVEQGVDIWSRLLTALGLDHHPQPGEQVRLTPPGLDPIDAVADWSTVRDGFTFVGFRTAVGMLRFQRGYAPGLEAAHHMFAAEPTADDWKKVLESL